MPVTRRHMDKSPCWEDNGRLRQLSACHSIFLNEMKHEIALTYVKMWATFRTKARTRYLILMSYAATSKGQQQEPKMVEAL